MNKILSIFGLLIFTSCSFSSSKNFISEGDEQGKEKFSLIQQKYEEKQQSSQQVQISVLPKTVELSLKENAGHVEVMLSNPKADLVQSVRVWLAFKSGALQVKNLNLNSKIFDLAAPGEFLVDKENGIIKIGLSASKGINETSISVGSFDVINLTNDPVPLTCYNYSEDTDSHCTVLGSEKKNILIEPSGLLIKNSELRTQNSKIHKTIT